MLKNVVIQLEIFLNYQSYLYWKDFGISSFWYYTSVQFHNWSLSKQSKKIGFLASVATFDCLQNQSIKILKNDWN